MSQETNMDVTAKQAPVARRLRLWPAVLIVTGMLALRFGLPVVVPERIDVAVLSGLAGSLLVGLWWLFLSRAPWRERLVGVAVVAIALVVTRLLVDRSIVTGMMGMALYIYSLPVLSVAFVAWALLRDHLPKNRRTVTLAAAIGLSLLPFTLIRTYGINASAGSDFAWRWSLTAEEKLLAQAEDEPDAVATTVTETAIRWPGFRGENQNGVVRGTRIGTDWQNQPPVALWRQPVGPGWSSFAVRGDYFFTQEQRGEEETLSCYRLDSGEVVWRHGDSTRFWESNAGAGPRATPTLHGEMVYSFGANGVLNALRAADGSVVWSRNVAEDTGAEVPTWGLVSSPLIVNNLVVVHAGQLAAYDLATGEPRWTGPTDGVSYSSARHLSLDGSPQIMIVNQEGATSVDPANGTVLWQKEVPGFPMALPLQINDTEILIGSSRTATRRWQVTKNKGTWSVHEVWSSNGLKPYFNGFVVHEGFVFGFDGSILSCIDLETGERRWKGGRYGHGQMLLLPDQDLILVVTEKGAVALVSAKPEGFEELANIPAIDGKTWNHPVLVDHTLLVRNDREMAAFRLPLQ